MPPIDEDPIFEDFDDIFSTFFVDFDDGMQLAFHPYPEAPPRLARVQLKFGATGQELARYNVHGTEGGGKFSLVYGDEYRHELGVHWALAYQFLRPRPFTSRKRECAWSYLAGTLVYAERLQKSARTGLFGT